MKKNLKKLTALLLALTMLAALTACGSTKAETPTASTEPTATTEPTPESTPEATAEPTPEPTPEATAEPTPEPTPEATAEPTPEPTAEPAPAEEAAAEEAELAADEEPAAAEVNLYVLSGPTGIGAMNLWAASDAGQTENTYHITMPGANDEVVAAISNGEADIAAVATNLAATLYNKTNGGVKVLAVNTLGVLSMLSAGEQLGSVKELKGRTIYLPGQGANPEYILRYVLKENGLDPDQDVTLQFVAEGSELMNVWTNDINAFIMAPQPVATSLLMNNVNAVKLFDMTDEWNAVSGGKSTLMMGCVIVRTEFLEENPGAVETFLKEYEASILKAQEDAEGTAMLCQNYGLIAKAALAELAIPHCGLTFVTGAQMREQLSGYLQVMYDANPKSVGGTLPADDFYYGA